MSRRHTHTSLESVPEVLTPPSSASGASGRPEGAIAHNAERSGERDIRQLEEDASAGCSVCARALVNARQTTADLAIAAAGQAPPSTLRQRVMESVRKRGLTGSRHEHDEERVVDPAGAVAHIHISRDEDGERIQEVDELGCFHPRSGDACERLLAQVERALRFVVYFVSVVRGERVGYRAQRGLPPELEGMTEMRREMTFCTHCVDADEPFVVENAVVEPFFRRSKMVVQYGVGAYAGVPLRSIRGVTVGTLCALDVSARKIGDVEVRLLEVFAEAVVAEIERDRTPGLRGALLEHAVSGEEVYREAWFSRLCDLERERAQTSHPTALVRVTNTTAAEVGRAALPSEVAGRISAESFGILMPGASASEAAARAADIAKALPGAVVTLS